MSRPTRGQAGFLSVRGCHPLWPDFPDGSGSYLHATGLVRVRSPLLTESRLMSFPPATEMFQFAGFASCGYGFTARYPQGLLQEGGLPHSEIPGSKGARASPGLFAACHVLHRLSAPRHSPDALGSLAPLQQRAPNAGTFHLNEVAVPTAKPEQRLPLRAYHAQKIAHPEPPAPHRSGTRTNRTGRTHATIAPERLPASRASPEHGTTIDRDARVRPDLPLHDVERTTAPPPTRCFRIRTTGRNTSRTCHQLPSRRRPRVRTRTRDDGGPGLT